jgi:hypothetical protein
MTSSATQTQQENQNLAALYRGTWPVERTLWHSGPSSIGGTGGSKGITQVALSCDIKYCAFVSLLSSALRLFWGVLVDAGFLCNKAAEIGVKRKERPCTMLTLQHSVVTVVGTRQLASCM